MEEVERRSGGIELFRKRKRSVQRLAEGEQKTMVAA